MLSRQGPSQENHSTPGPDPTVHDSVPIPIGHTKDGTPIYPIDPNLMCSTGCLLRYIPPPHLHKCPGSGDCFNHYHEHTMRKAAGDIQACIKAEKMAKEFAKLDVRAETRALVKLQAPQGKRHPGGQPGNQNARKHGFHSRFLTKEEFLLLQEALAAEDLSLTPEIALARIKYLKGANDSRVSTDDFSKLARTLTNMIRTQKEIDGFYGPVEENDS